MDSLNTYLFIASILFSLGLFGVITRRNGVAVLMGIELILNAANLNFLAFAKFGGMNISGHIFCTICHHYGCGRSGSSFGDHYQYL